MTDVYIDDADPRVQYSTGWGTAGVAKEYNGTTHWTGRDGATATLVFTGTGITVYGTIASKERTTDGPITIFSIDGSKQDSYHAVPAVNTKYKVPFFNSQTLQNGQHTIIITNSQNSSPFFLDYFVVSSPSPPQSPDVSQTSPLDTATAFDTMPLPTISPGMNGHSTNSNYDSSSRSLLPSNSTFNCTPGNTNPLPVPTINSATTNPNSSTLVSAIVGTLLGCFVLILTVIFIVLLRRHKSNRSTSLDLSRLNSQRPTVVPFMMQADNTMMHRTLRAVHSSTNGAYDSATTSHSTVQWQPMFKSLLGACGEGHGDGPAIESP